MIKKTLHLYMGVAAAAVFLLLNSCFILDQTEQAIILRFGQPRAILKQAGLKFKLPAPIETVVIFEKRILEVDPPAETVNILSDREQQTDAGKDGDKNAAALVAQTTQGMPISVDTFARYRITDPLKFLQRLRTETNAEARISNVMNGATRDVLSQATLGDLLSTKRTELMADIKKQVNEELREQGVEMVDLRIVRADLTHDLQAFTVNRMVTQQREQATKTRSYGQQMATQIRSQAERERNVTLAQAQRKAQETRGEGDKQAIAIYAQTFGRDPEFYRFWRTMDAYRTALTPDNTRFVLTPSGDFLGHLKSR